MKIAKFKVFEIQESKENILGGVIRVSLTPSVNATFKGSQFESVVRDRTFNPRKKE